MRRLPPRPGPRKKQTMLELWEQLRPGTPPPRLRYTPPFIDPEKANSAFLGFVVRFIQFEQFKEETLTSPVFLAWLFFSCVGYYTVLRSVYHDQLWTYGIRQQLPGLAHQIQDQRFTTFQYITAPMAVQKARQLGTKFSDSSQSASPVIQFLETPFLKRLDMYPNVALFDLAPQWTSLLGDNYTFTRPAEDPFKIIDQQHRPKKLLPGRRFIVIRTKKLKRPHPLLRTAPPGVIPILRTSSTVSPVEYRPIHQVDPWAKQRLVFDLADEVPTRLADPFSLSTGMRGLNRMRFLRPEGPSFLQPMAAFFNPLQRIVTGPFSVLKARHFAFQTQSESAGRLPFTAVTSPTLFGIPVAEAVTPQIHLPAAMLNTKPSEPSRHYTRTYGNKSGRTDGSAPMPTRHPTEAFGRRSLLALDKGLAATGELTTIPTLEDILTKLGRRKRKQALSIYARTHTDPLGFSPFHPLRQKSWIFDFVGLTNKELQARPPAPLPPPPEPPLGFAAYQKRRHLFTKKKATGPLVRIVKRGTDLLKYPEKTKNLVEALREYRRALEAYRPQRLAHKTAAAKYARVQQKVQDLRYLWNEQLPQALLDHIQQLPVSWELVRPAKTKPSIGTITVGSLDWFAHLPVTQQDWLLVFYDLGARVTPEDGPLTIADTRSLLQRLFKSDFNKPHHFALGRLKRRFLGSLGRVVDANLVDVYETRALPSFYRRLRNRGLSTGMTKVTKRRFFRLFSRKQLKPLPASWRITKPSSLKAKQRRSILTNAAFYAPLTDWMDNVFILGRPNYRLKLPKGAEFHWALHAHNFAARPQTIDDFAEAMLVQLGKIHPIYPDFVCPREDQDPGHLENRDRRARAQQLRDAILTQTHSYLRQVETSGLLQQRAGDRADTTLSEFMYRLQATTALRRISNDLAKVIREQGSLALVGNYRQNWCRSQPAMHGFLFPDTDRKTLHHQIQMSQLRYKLGAKSLWDGFQALTSIRPLEILPPPGYRLFVSRSLPDFSRPGATDYQRVNIFPRYDASRNPSLLPSYDQLKKHYADLDVSFLPESPKPRLRHKRTIYDIESELPETIGIGPYPNYFQYPKTLARQNGDIDIDPSVLHLIHNYYLGAQNWIKDMPRNFLGFQGFTRGDLASPFLRKMQREQVKPLSTAQEKAAFAGPETGPRLPSQLEDNTFRSVQRHAKITASVKTGFFKKKTYPLAKHTAHLESGEVLTLPQLTMDEWHGIFKTSLERARVTGETTLNLDIPPVQPVVYHRPAAVEGMIHVDRLAGEEKQRSQALAQILLLASEAKLGAYNIPDYLGVRALQAAHPLPTPGTQRNILPIFWHYSISRFASIDRPVPTLYNRKIRTDLTNAARKWESAEDFILRQRLQSNPFTRLFATFAPAEVLGNEPEIRNSEPVTIYSWFIFSQFLLVPIVLVLTKWVKFIVIRDFYIELHYRTYPFFKSNPYISNAIFKSLRRCYHWTGQIPYEPFRVFRDIKRRFQDIVGIEPDVLCFSGEIALSLRNRGRGGPASPKGVLLYGPPGNGKTFLVQAIAGEADVPLIALTTSELLDKRKHSSSVDGLVDAFKLAKELAPCILFIDEIDGLGMKRSSMLAKEAEAPNPENGLWQFVRTVPPRITLPFISRGKLGKAYADAQANPLLAEKKLRERSIEGLLDRKRYNIDTEDDYRTDIPVYEPPPPRQVLSRTGEARVALVTAFLALMDRLRPQDGIVVIGATNRISVLDPAVQRSGRLDMHIGINAPADERRVEIMRYYTSRLGLQEPIPWDYMAERTRAYSIADLETMVNQSAMMAIVKGEGHTLNSLEDALEATSRHRHIRANRIPYPIVKRRPEHDPLFFVRIAYYQSSRALVHNILPNHPSLPFVQMQLEPFAPEVPIEKLVRHAYTLQDLEDRVTAMLAGKAGEFLYLYGCPFKTQEELNDRQLFESNLGVDEIGYATDLAYAIVDQWLMVDDFALPIRKALKLQEGQNEEMFFEPGGDIGRPHFLLYNLKAAAKQHARQFKLQTSMFDKKFRIHNSLVDTLRWFAETKASMNLITEHFLIWSRLFAPRPFIRNVWEPVEQYYSKRPYFKLTDPSNPPSPNDKLTEVRVRPTFPDLALVDRDYLMEAVILKCFNKALDLLDEHRTLLDRMAVHLSRQKKLRSFEMHAYIQAYTDELRALKPETPVRMVPQKGEVPDLRTAPESRLRTIQGRDYLVIDQSWGPDSLKPSTKRMPTSIFTEYKDAPVWFEAPPITFDIWRQPVQVGDYLKKLQERLQGQRYKYAERYAYARQLHEELFHQRIAEINAERDAPYRFVEDLLLSMVPPLAAYVRQLDASGARPAPSSGENQGGISPPKDQNQSPEDSSEGSEDGPLF